MSLTREHLTIAGPDGGIEAIVDEAEDVLSRAAAGRLAGGDAPAGGAMPASSSAGATSAYYGVICHPHPLYGGTMDNKVVYTLARALNGIGIPTLRFNFRGVGQSGGSYDHGVGETADAAAVADHGALRWPGRALALAGFSFGSYVALRLAAQRRPGRLVTVAPPVQRFEFDFAPLGAPGCPWLIVQGEADDLVDPAAVRAWVAGLDPKPLLRMMPGVGHFFHGNLGELREAVQEMFRSG